MKFSYKEQPSPDGLAQAFILGEEFIGDDNVALVLGDNIFYGDGFSGKLKSVVKNIETNGGATVFGYYVKDPQRLLNLTKTAKSCHLSKNRKNQNLIMP